MINFNIISPTPYIQLSQLVSFFQVFSTNVSHAPATAPIRAPDSVRLKLLT